jgi:hypothetical protein
MRENGEQAGHGRQISWENCWFESASTPKPTQGTWGAAKTYSISQNLLD